MSEIQLDDNDLKPLWLPDDLLQRIDAAYALKFLGLPISYDSLSQMASRRVGPPFIKRGRLTLYRYSDLVAWAEEEKKYLPARRLG
jgi:hypothetical protein